ncbi:hypothetical protein [Aurantiacibacter luteus]|uniref:Uncharacterized protein n=1 Tax=Aurantiacibacter luteus TaxID=1581420 RepID=A0A0G9MWW3_9SPHN|nr:hypothetical protein [Aurantiacibacter luteus]KLE35267.1 hypothetical protein AAW00_02015 [Aurantiacibacter luteus]
MRDEDRAAYRRFVERYRAHGGSPREDLLFARHAAQLGRNEPFRTLTVTDYLDGEGAGSRALMLLWTMGFCRIFGVAYAHTPLTRLTHADRPQAEFDTAWEAFFNLGAGEAAAGDDAADLFLLSHVKLPEGGDCTRFLDPPLERPRPAYYLEIDSLEHDALRRFYAFEFVEVLSAALPEARRRFRAANPRAGSDLVKVAVHLRRGDVGPERSDMWTSDEQVAATLAGVAGVLDAMGLAHRITLYSEGERGQFAALEGLRPRMVLDGDPIQTMRGLADADVLVSAKSCFSYVAGLLGDGVVLAEASRWPAMPGWIERGTDGSFDGAALEAALTARRP